MQKKILLVGESWTSTSTHVKGFDQFATATWHTGATDFLAALADSPYAITYMPAHAAATDFPLTLEALQEWDAIILSDIGANTLLLHPDTWLKSRRTANRLTLLHDYVAGGGALMMIGGYYSFQGINGGARYRHTAVEKVLPLDRTAIVNAARYRARSLPVSGALLKEEDRGEEQLTLL